jgi:hypothetical protein
VEARRGGLLDAKSSPGIEPGRKQKPQIQPPKFARRCESGAHSSNIESAIPDAETGHELSQGQGLFQASWRQPANPQAETLRYQRTPIAASSLITADRFRIVRALPLAQLELQTPAMLGFFRFSPDFRVPTSVSFAPV